MSSTVRSSSRLKNWKMIPTCRDRNRASAPSLRLSIRRPATVTVPAVGRSSPAIRFSIVDFPLPDAPITATTSPAATLMLTSPRAGGEPFWYFLVTPSRRITSPPAADTVRTVIRSFPVHDWQNAKQLAAGGSGRLHARRLEACVHGGGSDRVAVSAESTLRFGAGFVLPAGILSGGTTVIWTACTRWSARPGGSGPGLMPHLAW